MGPNYTLSLRADKLVVEKRYATSEEIAEEGYLAYVDDTLTVVPNAASNSSLPL